VSNAFIMLSTGKSYTVNASTGAITSKNQAMMFMKNASYERLTIAEASTYAGLSVRCIREKAK
ncbi:MAG: hypothetical protein PHV49_05020, partial [Alistipes sp.]|nr:hypothetical protein [Alistipes sp.]